MYVLHSLYITRAFGKPTYTLATCVRSALHELTEWIQLHVQGSKSSTVRDYVRPTYDATYDAEETTKKKKKEET